MPSPQRQEIGAPTRAWRARGLNLLSFGRGRPTGHLVDVVV